MQFHLRSQRGRTPACLRRVRNVAGALELGTLLAVAGCTDSATPTISGPSVFADRSEGRGVFQRYVALGTGMSMGATNSRLTSTSQYESWPAQLARMAHRELTQPYVADPGCTAAPVLGYTTSICSLGATVSLPAQNLAIHAARALGAMNATTGNAGTYDFGTGFADLLPVVLPPGLTQVGAMHALKPKIVSVEYGTSELLRMLRYPGPQFSVTAWMESYDAILDEVAKETDHVVLALPPTTVPPGYVTSGLFDRATLLTEFNVVVPTDPIVPNGCETGRAIYAPVYINSAVNMGLARRAQGLGPYITDCTSQFFYNQLSVSGDMRDAWFAYSALYMRPHIREQAALRGFATFDLNVIYTSYTQPPFDVVAFVSSAEPFGPYVSADGVYPSAAGNRLLAEAAARALNEQYGLGIPVSASALVVR